MKKTIKIVLIVLLVAVAIATTCFFFFSNLNKEKSKEISLLTFAESEQKEELYSELNKVVSTINSDGTDARFDHIIQTVDNLEKSYNALTTYYLDSNFVVKNGDVVKSIKALNSSVSASLEMIEQYNIKANHTALNGNKYFNRHEGANDLYVSLAKYIVEYSNLITIVNDGIKDVNKGADVKFAVINVYTDVAEQTFSSKNIELSSLSRKQVKDISNMQWLNARYEINHLYLETSNPFTADNNAFVKKYNECDKSLFASKLLENINKVTELNEDLSKEEISTYYFKKVMG